MDQQQSQQPNQETAKNDKEYNFRQQEARFQQMLEKERQEKLAMQQELERLKQKRVVEDEEDDEPYVDHKKLNKVLNSFEEKFEKKVDERAEMRARMLLQEREQESYLQQNSDFNKVMSPDTLQKFAEKHPGLAKSFLNMPDGFERQKAVYEAIKAVGLDRPEQKQPSIQEKIDANRRSPYYQPSGVGTAPYSSAGDFSSAGQKNAYDKMMELKKRIRL